jgi:hypothetical protein
MAWHQTVTLKLRASGLFQSGNQPAGEVEQWKRLLCIQESAPMVC